MQKHLEKLTTNQTLLISAVQQEVFSRIFPKIRHDLVGYLSASLMRVSIMDRYLSKEEVAPNQLKAELLKIESYIRSSIDGIRALGFWDFQSIHDDYPSEILKKCVELMSTRLAMQGTQLMVVPQELEDIKKVETKPLLYSLLCLLSYIEDNNFENNNLKIHKIGKSIVISSEPKIAQNSTAFKNVRNLTINRELALDFAKFQNMNINISIEEIKLTWN
jgi:hypothetical protein